MLDPEWLMLVPRDLDRNLIQQQNNKREDEQDANK